MLFNSFDFAVFLPIVFFIYCNKKNQTNSMEYKAKQIDKALGRYYESKGNFECRKK